MVMVSVGSRHETDKIAGIAHFVEHTIFKGTSKRPTSKQIGMEIELLGGNSNAFTSNDYTGYYIKAPAGKQKEALEILSDMLKNSLFAKAEIEKERRVIIEEIKMYEDIARSKVDDIFMHDVYRSHPMAREITGSVASLNGLNREDLEDFVKQNYTGSNMLISIAGNLELETMEKLVEEYFGKLPQGIKAPFEKVSKHALSGKVNFVNKKLEQTHLIFGGFGYPRKNDKRYAYQVGNAILSYGFGSRLFQVLRDELGLAYYVDSGIPAFSDHGLFKIAMGVDSKRVGIAVNSALKELSSLKTGDFSKQEFERAKNFLIGSLITQLETSEDLGSWFGSQKLLRDELVTGEETIKRITKVTKDEVLAAWAPLLTPQNLHFSLLGPKQFYKNEIDASLIGS
jgi:predicted Zn-dependent peptidase